MVEYMTNMSGALGFISKTAKIRHGGARSYNPSTAERKRSMVASSKSAGFHETLSKESMGKGGGADTAIGSLYV